MFNDDDIFEFEDGFSNSQTTTDEPDEDTEYVLEIMKEALSLFEEASNALNRLIEINNIFGQENTGLKSMDLRVAESTFSNLLPNVLLGEDEDNLIKTVQFMLSASEDVAKKYIEDKRTSMLQKIIDNKNK